MVTWPLQHFHSSIWTEDVSEPKRTQPVNSKPNIERWLLSSLIPFTPWSEASMQNILKRVWRNGEEMWPFSVPSDFGLNIDFSLYSRWNLRCGPNNLRQAARGERARREKVARHHLRHFTSSLSCWWLQFKSRTQVSHTSLSTLCHRERVRSGTEFNLFPESSTTVSKLFADVWVNEFALACCWRWRLSQSIVHTFPLLLNAFIDLFKEADYKKAILLNQLL